MWLVSSRCIHLHGQRLGVALRELVFWGMDMEVQALRDLPLALLPSGPAALVAAWDIIDPSKESTSWTRSSTGEPSEVLSIPRYDISAIEILDPGILNGLYWLTANPNECFVLICFDFSPMFTDLCVVKILSVCVFFYFCFVFYVIPPVTGVAALLDILLWGNVFGQLSVRIGGIYIPPAIDCT